MTAELTFVDTNVLLHAHDRSAAGKLETATTLLAALWEARTGVLSTQVLEEFYVNATRKLPKPMSPARARPVVGRYATWRVQTITPGDILAASELEQRDRLSFWDALVVGSASRAGATQLVTEGLQAGRVIAGVRITNPFTPVSAG